MEITFSLPPEFISLDELHTRLLFQFISNYKNCKYFIGHFLFNLNSRGKKLIHNFFVVFKFCDYLLSFAICH